METKMVANATRTEEIEPLLLQEIGYEVLDIGLVLIPE